MAALLQSTLQYLQEKEADPSYNLVSIRGVPQNPTFDVAKFEQLIDNFEPKSGDVFIATYVKAGTTWTQQIIHLLLRKGEPGGFYGESIPWLEAVTSDMLNPREAPTWSLDSINSADGPRYFKTHATVDHLPGRKVNEGRSDNSKSAVKVVCVARNPKDTAVSLFHHARSKPEFGLTDSNFEHFCELFLAGKVENGSWFSHVLDWYKLSKEQPDNHLFLQYEDMYQDPTAAVWKIAAFLGVECSDEIVAKVVQHSTIQEMREKASIGLNHLRKGGYGGWRTVFTVRMSEVFDEVYQHHMNGSELKFNFGATARGEDVIM